MPSHDPRSGGIPSLVPNIGAEFELSRGVTASTCKFWLPHRPSIDAEVGTLSFSDGSTTVEFPEAAIAPGSLRCLLGRQGFVWTVMVKDRRWKWVYPVISGEYNIRACGVNFNQKPLRELLALLLDALQETSYSINNAPDVQPYVKWDNNRAAQQLAHLCDRYGLVICLGSDNRVRIEGLGRGASLPAGPTITPAVTNYSHATLPSRVRAVSGSTIYSDQLALEAVGLDSDGSIELLDFLSYRPARGWDSQWYTTFDGVSTGNQHLAFKTVWRWYRVRTGFSVGDTTISDLSRVRLIEDQCYAASLYGTFWPLSDLKINVTENYSGNFTLLPDLGIVALEYPCIQWSDDYPLSADLSLTTSFSVRQSDGSFATTFAELDIPWAVVGTEARVDKHKYLQVYNSAGNESEVLDELNKIVQAIADSYTNEPGEDRWYEGIRDIQPDGAIAQVRWRTGRAMGCSTRASRHMEFAVFTPSHQERRRRERVVQLTDELL